MKAYKGFNRDMTCRGFQYKEGGEYETDQAEVCDCGFHACEHPLDCLGYYEPGTGSVYHEVELDGKIDKKDNGDTKVAATKIKIGARLSIAGLVKAAIDYTMARIEPEAKADEKFGAASATGDSGAASATGDRGAASATGDRGAASATGYSGAASATGDRGAASATGYKGAASATGDRGAASATGDSGAASATGYSGAASATGYKGAASAGHETAIAVAWGILGKAKGVKGAHIVLADWRQNADYDWVFHGAKMVRIDGKKYKADTWYTVKNGKVVEVEE